MGNRRFTSFSDHYHYTLFKSSFYSLQCFCVLGFPNAHSACSSSIHRLLVQEEPCWNSVSTFKKTWLLHAGSAAQASPALLWPLRQASYLFPPGAAPPQAAGARGRQDSHPSLGGTAISRNLILESPSASWKYNFCRNQVIFVVI